MPPKVEDCVDSVLEDNPDYDESRAWAICKAQFEADVDDPEVHALSETDIPAEGLDQLSEDRPEWGRFVSRHGIAWVGLSSGSTVYQANDGDPIAETVEWIAEYVDAADAHTLDDTVGDMADWINETSDDPSGALTYFYDVVGMYVGDQGIDPDDEDAVPLVEFREWLEGERGTEQEQRPGGYAYPDAAPEDAPPEVREAVERFRENPDPDTPLLYRVLGTGTDPYKMAKADADYQGEPNDGEACQSCEYFYTGADGESICSQVAGGVEPEAWCRLYEAADIAAADGAGVVSRNAVLVDGLSTEAREGIERRYNVQTLDFMQEVPDDAVSISDPSEAPEDARTVTGPRGGLYYIPAEGDGNGDLSVGDLEAGDEVRLDATIDTPGGEVDISEDNVEVRLVTDDAVAIEHPEYGLQTIQNDAIDGVSEAVEDAAGDDDDEDATPDLGGADSPAEAAEQAIGAVDFEDTVSLPESTGNERILSEDQSAALEDALKEVVENSDMEATAEDVDSVYDQVESWKTSSYSDDAQTTERIIAEAAGVSDNYRNDTLDGREPRPGEVEAMEMAIDAAQEFVREEYGEDATASRGISEQAAVPFFNDFLGNTDMEDTSLVENTVANYSVSDDVAQGFAKAGVTVNRGMDPDEVLGAPDLMANHRAPRHQREGEVWLPGGEQDVTPDQVVFANEHGDSVTMAEIQETGIDNLDEEAMLAIHEPVTSLIGPAQTGDIELGDAQQESLTQIRDRAEELGHESTVSEINRLLEA